MESLTVTRHQKSKTQLLNLHLKYSKREEKEVSSKFQQAEQRFKTLREADDKVQVAKNFLTHVDNYAESELVKLLKQIPKGAHLHLHSLAAGCFRKFAKHIHEAPNLYVTDRGNFQFCSSEKADKMRWRGSRSMSEEEIYDYITMPKGENTLSKEDCWQRFGEIWSRVLGITLNSYFYEGTSSFFYELLQDQYESGVRYLELRNGGEVYHNAEGNEISPKEYLRVIKDTVEAFKVQYPDFIGCRMILAGHKGEENSAVEAQVKAAVELNKDPEVGDLIAGFDMVGEEDAFHPLESYVKELKFAQKNGLPLLLHAGETNNSDRTCLYDAFLLGARRIGHAYDLINHPVLLEKVVSAAITVECCPISNNSLCYVSDSRNHSGKTMLAHGVKLAFSADDPGMFHYHDVSFDWALAAKAWKLSLRDLKDIGKNSIDAAQMSEDEKRRAFDTFDRDWEVFIDTLTSN